jgi:YNFM family putative membrane transporter
VGTAALAELASWRFAVGTVAVVGLAAAAVFVAILPPSRRFARRPGLGLSFHLRAFGRHLGHPRLPLLFLAAFVLMGSFVTVYNYTTFRLTAPPYSLRPGQVGLIFTAYLFGIAGSSLAGALADRLGRGPVLVAGVLTTGLGLLLTAAASLAWIIAGIVVLTIGFFGSHSVTSGWVGPLAGSEKGHATSLYLLGYYLGSSVLGSVGGWFWAGGGWPAILGMTGALLAVALLIALTLARSPRDADSYRGGTTYGT